MVPYPAHFNALQADWAIAAPTRPAADTESMDCIIVRRGNYQVYGGLHQIFGEFLPVVWDRRHAGRDGKPEGSPENERRQALPPNWAARGYFIASVATERTASSSWRSVDASA